VIVFGYEHSPPRIDLELAVMAFEIVAEHVNGLTLGERYVAEFDGLIHPVHQQGRVYGWEVL
jgi:hypothetical protein